MQELAYALATAVAVLDRVRGIVPAADFPAAVGRISFFVNAGLRFVTEICKMRAFTELWDGICEARYGVDDPKLRRFRYGVQVNSLGLTEQQPENNVYRILLEALAVTLSKDARARAVQLPAWNEALGLPRPWDQQWSLRLQQILAWETDLLEYGDIFEGSTVIAGKVAELKREATAELERIEALGGAVAAVESGYMKQRLVASNARRVAAIEAGEQVVVGVNRWTESAPSPLTENANDGEAGDGNGGDGGFLAVDPAAERAQVESLAEWRAARDEAAAQAAIADLERAVHAGGNVMEPSIACAHAGVTTGEWGEALRGIFGLYRAPTGVGAAPAVRASTEDGIAALGAVRGRVEALSGRLGRRLKMLVGKPGLDGHSNGAEQIAVRARDCGIEVVYEGIRLTPAQIAGAALQEDVHIVGLSILSGGHAALVGDVVARLAEQGQGDVPVVVGGIVPPADAEALKAAGVAAVYTPKDFDLTAIMGEIVDIVERGTREAA